MEKRKIIEAYLGSWISGDIGVMKEWFHEEIWYSECYGPVYLGKEECLKWFESWNKLGTVIRWDISEYSECDDSSYVQWYFVCEYEGQIDGFDGVSFIRFEDELIKEVKEFSSDSKHVYPMNKNVVVGYDGNWIKDFELIKLVLEKSVGEFIDGVEHVGSTSVVGMMAKPVIDVDLVLKQRGMLAGVREKLSTLGYEYLGDMGIKDREAFKLVDKSDGVLGKIDHHLYVCPPNSVELARHLKFRDRLCEDKGLLEEYNRIKIEILDCVGWENRSGYVKMKEKNYKDYFDKVLGK